MKSVLFASFALAALVAAQPLRENAAPGSAPIAGTWVVDPVHSSVLFKIKHADCAWFYGMFGNVEGTISEGEKASDSSVQVRIAADSIDSRNEGRDKHLRSPDFFDVAQFPTITFTSTSVVEKGGAYEITGDLELHGQKKSVTAKATKTGEGEIRGKQAAGFETTMTIKRADFGMDYGIANKALGDEVHLVLSLECSAAPK